MILKFKKLHKDAVIPAYANKGDAGLDLVAVDTYNYNQSKNYYEYRTGLAVAIPENHVGLLFPRSSISTKGLSLANCVGVIDSGYRGELKLRFIPINILDGDLYKVGDKIGQLVIVPYKTYQTLEVDELDSTDRGDGGFGSTDLKVEGKL